MNNFPQVAMLARTTEKTASTLLMKDAILLRARITARDPVAYARV